MKKFTLVFIITILLCFSCEKLMAQAPYKASIVGTAYPCLTNVIGPTYKMFFADNIAFQTDIFFKSTLTWCTDKYGIAFAFYYAVESNTNIMYQKRIKDKTTVESFWFLGGGITLGCNILSGDGKFGTNVIMGLEYILKNAPISFQIDFRPGFGMLFNFDENLNNGGYIPDNNPWVHFDWTLAFTLRYTFKKTFR